MKYFRYFPKINYDLDDNGQTREVVDVFRFAKIINNIQDDIQFYRKYDIQDGERPDHVSYKLYESTDYHWSFFVANPEMKSLHLDWPRSYEEMEDYLSETYSDYVLNIGYFNPANNFEVGEEIEGQSSGATANIVSKTTSSISVNSKSGDFLAGETITGANSQDSIIIGTQIDNTGATATLTITAFDFFNKFDIGETVQGLISGATGVVAAKSPQLGWIKITSKNGNFRQNEIIRGLTSGDFITISGQAPERYAAHHYESGGYYVERTTPNAAIVTFEQWEIDKNDSKKQIKVIRPEYIDQVAVQFREAINE